MAVSVDEARDNLFAHAALAGDEHADIELARARNLLAQMADAQTLSHKDEIL